MADLQINVLCIARVEGRVVLKRHPVLVCYKRHRYIFITFLLIIMVQIQNLVNLKRSDR